MNQEKIGKFIAECRKEKNMTQNDLANILGVSDKSVSKWENAKCMPDLSLFPVLCKNLDITVNDLMSGEKVDKRNYLNNLENNIVNIVANVEERKNKRRKIFIVTLVAFIIVIFAGYLFYENYEKDVKYDGRVMKCTINDNELHFRVSGLSVLNNRYTSREIDGKTIYFFHSTINLYNKRNSNWEYSQSMARLLNGEDVPFAHDDRFYVEDNAAAYYTNESLNKIKKASEEKLKEILKESYLMCSSSN